MDPLCCHVTAELCLHIKHSDIKTEASHTALYFIAQHPIKVRRPAGGGGLSCSRSVGILRAGWRPERGRPPEPGEKRLRRERCWFPVKGQRRPAEAKHLNTTHATKASELAAPISPLPSLLLLLPRALKGLQVWTSRFGGPDQWDTSWARNTPLKTTTLMSARAFVHVEKKEKRVEEDHRTEKVRRTTNG